MDKSFENIIKDIVKEENTILLNQIKGLLETAGIKEQWSELMDFDECREFLTCSTTYLYKKVSLNEIPHIRHIKKLFFERSKVLEWLRGLK